MIPEQTLLGFPLFGDNATKVEPDNNKKSNGWQQGDVVPAEWMNWAWYHNSKGISDLNDGVASVEREVNNVLNEAGITPSASANNQLFKAVQKNNGCIITPVATPTIITGAPAIETGNVIKIMFGADVMGIDTTTGLIISYNGSTKTVKVNKNGSLEEMKAHKITPGTFKYIQANTIIEFVYDGVDFVVIGNPLVMADTSYKIYANGDTYESITGSAAPTEVVSSSRKECSWRKEGNIVQVFCNFIILAGTGDQILFRGLPNPKTDFYINIPALYGSSSSFAPCKVSYGSASSSAYFNVDGGSRGYEYYVHGTFTYICE